MIPSAGVRFGHVLARLGSWGVFVTVPDTNRGTKSRTSWDQPMTKIASGRSAWTAAIVSGAFTSAVSTSGAPTSSKEHWPERLGSIGPGSVTTPAISAPASRAASRVSRPIMSKLTQTARTGADSTEEGRAASCRCYDGIESRKAMAIDRVRAAIEAEAKLVERETGSSALAHRMATSAWRWVYLALGVPTTALAAIAGASALGHYRVVAAVFALAAAIASALLNFLNPGVQAADHRKATARYRAIEN